MDRDSLVDRDPGQTSGNADSQSGVLAYSSPPRIASSREKRVASLRPHSTRRFVRGSSELVLISLPLFASSLSQLYSCWHFAPVYVSVVSERAISLITLLLLPFACCLLVTCRTGVLKTLIGHATFVPSRHHLFLLFCSHVATIGLARASLHHCGDTVHTVQERLLAIAWRSMTPSTTTPH